MAAIGGVALSIALGHMKRQKVLAAVVIAAMFLQGGGILTFMIRSDQSWYWPNSSIVKVNSAAKKIATHVVVKKVKR
jgi:hypothetical protein